MATQNIKKAALAVMVAAVMTGCTVQTEEEVAASKLAAAVETSEAQVEQEAPATIAYAVTDRTGEVIIEPDAVEPQETFVDLESDVELDVEEDVVDELFGEELVETVVEVEEPEVDEVEEVIVETQETEELVVEQIESEQTTFIQVFATEKPESGEKVVAEIMADTGKEAHVVAVGDLYKVIVGPFVESEVQGALDGFKETRDYNTAFVTDLTPAE